VGPPNLSRNCYSASSRLVIGRESSRRLRGETRIVLCCPLVDYCVVFVMICIIIVCVMPLYLYLVYSHVRKISVTSFVALYYHSSMGDICHNTWTIMTLVWLYYVIMLDLRFIIVERCG
jgi:hypothetical protein